MELVPRRLLAVAPPSPLEQAYHQSLLHFKHPHIRQLALQPRQIDRVQAVLSVAFGSAACKTRITQRRGRRMWRRTQL